MMGGVGLEVISTLRVQKHPIQEYHELLVSYKILDLHLLNCICFFRTDSLPLLILTRQSVMKVGVFGVVMCQVKCVISIDEHLELTRHVRTQFRIRHFIRRVSASELGVISEFSIRVGCYMRVGLLGSPPAAKASSQLPQILTFCLPIILRISM